VWRKGNAFAPVLIPFSIAQDLTLRRSLRWRNPGLFFREKMGV
jgi:hypothetical protein